MALTNHIVPDSPTNNFCTLNPLFPATVTYAEGNLKVSPLAYSGSLGNFEIPTSGKWYFEGVITSTPQTGSDWDYFGIQDYTQADSDVNVFTASGKYWSGSTWTSLGSTWSQNDILGVAVDMDSSEISYYINGSQSGTTKSLNYTGKTLFPALRGNSSGTSVYVTNFGQDPTFAGAKSPTTTYTDANGIGAFYYQPPTGALALCTANLPDFTPTVTGDVPQDYFKAKVYSGTNSNQNIDIGFNPDFVWTKQKNGAQEHWFNSTVLGTNYTISINLQVAPASGTGNGVNNFSPTTTSYQISAQDGLNINGTNNLVSWSWKAGGFSSNFNINGSTYSSYNDIQSDHSTNFPSSTVGGTPAILTPNKISVNTISGFSCLTFTGTGVAAKIPHGLGSAPKFFISKRISDYSTSHWDTWHVGLGATKSILLNLNGGEYVTDKFYDTAPDDLYYYVKGEGGVNRSGSAHVTFLWAEIEGYSKCGSYTGNGSNSGNEPFVYTGFKPAWLMIKRSNTANDGWYIYDNARSSYNVVTGGIRANSPNQEDGTQPCDFLSNGFRIRIGANGNFNATNGTYIYMAFAEQPFKYANAR